MTCTCACMQARSLPARHWTAPLNTAALATAAHNSCTHLEPAIQSFTRVCPSHLGQAGQGCSPQLAGIHSVARSCCWADVCRCRADTHPKDPLQAADSGLPHVHGHTGRLREQQPADAGAQRFRRLCSGEPVLAGRPTQEPRAASQAEAKPDAPLCRSPAKSWTRTPCASCLSCSHATGVPFAWMTTGHLTIWHPRPC